jgi:hypothetical protein
MIFTELRGSINTFLNAIWYETLAERTSALAGEHLRRRQQRETLASAAILRFYAVEANWVSIRSQCWREIITCSPHGVDLT